MLPSPPLPVPQLSGADLGMPYQLWPRYSPATGSVVAPLCVPSLNRWRPLGGSSRLRTCVLSSRQVLEFSVPASRAALRCSRRATALARHSSRGSVDRGLSG